MPYKTAVESGIRSSWLSTAPIDDLYDHVKNWAGAVQEIIYGLRKGSADGKILKQALYVREPTSQWFDTRPECPGSGIILIGDSVHSTLPHQGQGACQAIESGFALAQTLKNWKDTDLASALQFFQDIRKPRTDRVTKSSYETGKMASADIPEELWTTAFNPEAVRERMRWVMDYDLAGELAKGLQGSQHAGGPADGADESALPPAVRVVC